MKICVFGLWHLGTVTAACLAEAGHDVIALDPDKNIISNLCQGKSPIYEPGLDELIGEGVRNGRLRFSSDLEPAIRETDLLWVTFDTPVNEDDVADAGMVSDMIKSVSGFFRDGLPVVISSQVPVGFTSSMEEMCQRLYPDKNFYFAYSPENLRLGKAIEIFNSPGRIIIGIRDASDQARFEQVFSPLCNNLIWMSTESAEMTKHAINAFLATSISFANELAVLCESVGASAAEVEEGLKSDERIGRKAYLKPGAAFSGGTLARDIIFLVETGSSFDLPVYLFKSVISSNTYHKGWVKKKIVDAIGELKNKIVAVWGLTYKAGTDTLRRSWSMELCEWLHSEGALIHAYDPHVKSLPENSAGMISLKNSAEDALVDAHCVVVATDWQIFKSIKPSVFEVMNGNRVVIDINGFLEKILLGTNNLTYYSVGKVRR